MAINPADNPVPSARRFRRSSFRQPITELVNETFCAFAASLPLFRRKAAAIPHSKPEFLTPRGPYGAALLTMIKIVLIAAISFAPLSQ
jgi:hypothetical protein